MKIKELHEALSILLETQGDDNAEANDDQMWCGEYLPQNLSKVELKRLEDLGWFEDEGAWSHFT